MAKHDTIVIGGSAGSIDPLLHLFAMLPAKFPASIFVVVHISAENTGALPEVLGRNARIPVQSAVSNDPIKPGVAYIAPPDRHLLVGDDHVMVTHGPRENGFRPAIDPLFYSAARSRGNRVVAVLLSGGLDDGTYGMTVVKERGGLAIVQNPDDALITGMPLSAIKNVEVDHIVRAAQLPQLLVNLVNERVNGKGIRDMGNQEPPVTSPSLHSWGSNAAPLNGPPSVFTCPECGGTLWELEEGKMLRYRCHTGHSYTMDTLAVDQNLKLEQALWNAARVLQEKTVLRRHLAKRLEEQGMTLVAQDYRRQADEPENQGALIRSLLVNGESNGQSHPRPKASRKKRDPPKKRRQKK